MPIDISVNCDEGYFVSRWSGEISDDEIVTAYRAFLQSPHWKPGLNEFADFSAADLKHVSCNAFRQLCDLIKAHLIKHDTSMVCVSYAPDDIHYGMLRLYSSIAELSPELSQVFRDKAQALAWLQSHKLASEVS